ncbi:uncharacterized protein LOC129964244 [Argiope bruennichi]|uniref:uncharacterized protein LOC129964244 n=1 Tax=Argiope bruennichi TaxID=94029 RepID=UPI0024945289|nr:uncharacterized protein LOC129964244 [Argiope bruennichi]
MGSSKKSPFSGHRTVQSFVKNNSYHDSFFVIKRVSELNETFNSVSPFLVQKAFAATIGDVTSIRKMRSGDLLVEVNSKKQAQQIMKLKALADIRITVSPHLSLNYSKGVITCGELFNVLLEEIAKELKPQGVTNVQQISIRRNEQILPTKHYILTFHSRNIPEFIYAGYIKLPVRHFIPNPLRCFHCQRFGHSKANCRGTLTCARCAEKGHDSQQCSAPEKCANCDSSHASFSRTCERWQLEKRIITTKVIENISYPEARRKVLSQTPKPGISYAAVVQKPFCENCSCSNCTKSNLKTKPNPKISDSESENSTISIPETNEIETHKIKSKSYKSLKLKLSKRGLSAKDLNTKFKKSNLRSSVALGLANQGVVHKDLTSIFGGASKSSELISLHPSEGEDEELKMSCDASQPPPIVPNSLPATRIS